MSRQSSPQRIACRYFCWSLFKRNGVWYADGRSTPHRLGKHSLGTRDRDEAIAELPELDRRKPSATGARCPAVD